VNSVENF